MAGSYRHQALIEAPLEDVWEIVSDPRTHPEWWPGVLGVLASGELKQGDEYEHSSKLIPFTDAVTAIWVAERLEHLKEAHFRCTLSGTYAKFSLTPAQGNTFVELESGMDPTTFRWRMLKTVSRSYFRGWVIDVVDALPGVIRRRRGASLSR